MCTGPSNTENASRFDFWEMKGSHASRESEQKKTTCCPEVQKRVSTTGGKIRSKGGVALGEPNKSTEVLIFGRSGDSSGSVISDNSFTFEEDSLKRIDHGKK